MSKYFVELRYYPGDPLEEIKIDDLKILEKAHRVKISWEKRENREMKEGLLMERTLDKRIEDITQEVITVASDQEENFSDCIIALYKKYRCPRTPYALLGSNEPGQKIAKKLMDKYGGW
ncbi:MAG: hypothetical protein AMJ94_10200 [Deltaproteobacteria bacterium SM23_61]|nr:MAG: hypothetical protein AMJ94_10200 [Deltaproteobacteria bacterium SM23_61]